MSNLKTLISLSIIIPLILPVLSGFANLIPESMNPSIVGASTGGDHKNVTIEFEKSTPPNPQGTELHLGSEITRKSHLNFLGIDPFVHQSNRPTYISSSLSRNSPQSTKETRMWAQSQTGNICEDINTANASVLQRVNGIGRAKAQAIIAYRNQHGPFRSLDELTNVKGIGPATVENFRMGRVLCARRHQHNRG